MSEAAKTEMLGLVQAATALKVKNGERAPGDSQTGATPFPYVEASFRQMGLRTRVPRQKRGFLYLEIRAADGVTAWDEAEKLAEALGLSGVLCAPPRPSAVDSYQLIGALSKDDDPPGGGVCIYATVGFQYY